jgi:predicted CopG family antitoxin
LVKGKHDNLKMLRQIRKELSLELKKMAPEQRKEFITGTEDVYEGLKKMAKARQSIAR